MFSPVFGDKGREDTAATSRDLAQPLHSVISRVHACPAPTSCSSQYAGLEPPPLPVQLNANIHQSLYSTPHFHHLFLCAHACRTVGLIRPLLFTRVKQTTRQPRTQEADSSRSNVCVHLSAACAVQQQLCSDTQPGGERCTKTHTHTPLQHTLAVSHHMQLIAAHECSNIEGLL